MENYFRYIYMVYVVKCITIVLIISLQYNENFGNCRQIDSFNEYMTVRQHLKLFTFIRDVKEETIYPLLQINDLLDHSDKLVEHLSGGMKRKLSIAIAMVSFNLK